LDSAYPLHLGSTKRSYTPHTLLLYFPRHYIWGSPNAIAIFSN